MRRVLPIVIAALWTAGAHAATMIDMPAAPRAVEASGAVEASHTIGEVALARYAHARSWPRDTYAVGGWGGWPNAGYGWGYPVYGWGYPAYGWAYPAYGWFAWRPPWYGFSPWWPGWGRGRGWGCATRFRCSFR